MISKIALRNLLEHRSKTIIVGGLIALGATLLILGNSIMDSIDAGMRNTFTEQYSGDLFIYAPVENEGDISIFGSFTQEAIQPLDQLFEMEEMLAKQNNVKLVSKLTVGMGTLETELGEQTLSAIWGVDSVAWEQSFAQNLTWNDGGLWDEGDTAIALSQQNVSELEEAQGQPINVGDNVLITVMGDSGIKIRELTVSGIFEFKTIAAPHLEMMSLIDLKTTQSLFALDQINSQPAELTDAEESTLGEVTEDDLFGESGLFESDGLSTSSNDIFDSLETDVLATKTSDNDADIGTGFIPQYQFAVVLLDDPSMLSTTQQEIQIWADNNGLDWRIGDWQNAAGFIGEMTSGIRIVLNGLVVLITFVATLIIMNTLVISVTERLQEIGTMRAIGAQKSTIRAMILSETLILALASSFVGVLIASLLLWLANVNGIAASNHIMEILFGGEFLFPKLSISAVIQAIFIMTAGALLACLYPLGIALKVSPLKAMQG